MNHLDLSTITLTKNSHRRREDGVCALEAVAWFADLPHSDHPTCTDAVVASYVRALNDAMPDAPRQRLIPYIPRLASAANGRTPQDRAFVCADFAIHVLAPLALRTVPSLVVHAETLEHLPPIIDEESTYAARDAAYAAGDAAKAAAKAAAYAGDAAYAAYAAAYAAYAAYAVYAAGDAAKAAANAAKAAAKTAAYAGDARDDYANTDIIWDKALLLLDLLLEPAKENAR